MSEDTNNWSGPVETEDFKSAGWMVTWSLTQEEADSSHRHRHQFRNVYVPTLNFFSIYELLQLLTVNGSDFIKAFKTSIF